MEKRKSAISAIDFIEWAVFCVGLGLFSVSMAEISVRVVPVPVFAQIETALFSFAMILFAENSNKAFRNNDGGAFIYAMFSVSILSSIISAALFAITTYYALSGLAGGIERRTVIIASALCAALSVIVGAATRVCILRKNGQGQ